MKNNHKPKILFVITGLNTGGAEMMLLKILSKVDREIFSPEVVSLTDIGTVGPKIQKLGIPVHCLGMRPGWPDPLSILRFIPLVRRLRPDLIQGWMYHGNLAAQLISVFLPPNIPVLWNIRHSIYNLKFEKRLTALIIRMNALISKRPLRIIYNSQISASQHEALGFAPNKMMVIPNGFNTKTFAPSENARSVIRKELGLSSSTILIGLIARYHPMKDHGNFIQASAFLSKNFPNVHFLLAGKNVDMKNPYLKKLIYDLKLNNNLHLLGERKDINTLTASLDIATSSSYSEAFPNVIGEAMACGVPCAVTDVGDSKLIVGDTGKVIPARDPRALANAWQEFIELGLEGRREIGEKARSRIKKFFTLEKVASQYESLYFQLLNIHAPDLPQNQYSGSP